MKVMTMEINEFSKSAYTRLGVMPLGFAAMEIDKLKRIFDHAPSSKDRSYAIAHLGSGAEYGILLVNYDDPAAVAEKNALLAQRPHLQVVAVSQKPLSETPLYHLRGLLIGAKVLGLLDKIPLPGPAPAFPAQPAATTPLQPPALVAQPEPALGYRALVVDDSLAVQKSLETQLAGLARIAAVDLAGSGEEALEKAQAGPYDLIFLDVMMPGIDGYEACARLRKLPHYKKTPIIMVSGKNSPLDEVKGVIAGCTTYMTKPVQPEAFQKLSSRVLAWLDNYRTSGKTA
jgi:CheY-like chemotaxis protein